MLTAVIYSVLSGLWEPKTNANPAFRLASWAMLAPCWAANTPLRDSRGRHNSAGSQLFRKNCDARDPRASARPKHSDIRTRWNARRIDGNLNLARTGNAIEIRRHLHAALIV